MTNQQRWAVSAIVSAGAVLATLDQFIANIALPSIEHALHGSVPVLRVGCWSHGLVPRRVGRSRRGDAPLEVVNERQQLDTLPGPAPFAFGELLEDASRL